MLDWQLYERTYEFKYHQIYLILNCKQQEKRHNENVFRRKSLELFSTLKAFSAPTSLARPTTVRMRMQTIRAPRVYQSICPPSRTGSASQSEADRQTSSGFDGITYPVVRGSGMIFIELSWDMREPWFYSKNVLGSTHNHAVAEFVISSERFLWLTL